MEFSVSPLSLDMQYVIKNANREAYFNYKAEIRLEDGSIIRPIRIQAMDRLDDYQENYAGVFQITLMLSLGVYSHQVYPNRESLEIILHEPDLRDEEGYPTYQVYRAILISNIQGLADKATGDSNSQFALDISGVLDISFQLIDTRIDQLRTILTGGVFHNVKMGSLLRTTLTKALNQVDIDDEKKPLGIHLEGEYNDYTYPQIVIPHGLSIVDLPDYLQNKCGGVYSTGLSHFIDYKNWYVFPSFDTERFSLTEADYLEVILVPQNKFDVLNKTYLVNGNQIMIIAAGDRDLDNTTERISQDHGEGTRFMDANSLANNLVNTQDTNKAVLARARNMNEYQTEESKSGFSRAPTSNAAITSNQYKELTKLSAMKGTYFTILWNYSNPSLLRPGMMARIKYMDNDSLRILEGVLLGVNTTSQPIVKSLANSMFGHSTAMKFFVRRNLDLV